MEPIVNGLETEFSGQLVVTRLDANVRENEELEFSYGLRGHPAFAVLDAAGSVTATFIGPQPEEILKGAVTAVLRQPE
jgi:thioredoxin-like negative regulator of GroEL